MRHEQAFEAHLRARRARVLATRAVFYACLAYLVFLLVHLPVEDAADAFDRYAASHGLASAACARQAPGRAADAESLACLREDLAGLVDRARTNRIQVLVLAGLLSAVALLTARQRRRDEQVLREQLRFDELLIDAMPLPLSLRSPEGRFLLVNQAFEQRFGIARDALIGERVDDALGAERAQRIFEMDARAVASPLTQEGRFHVPTQQGMRHIQVSVRALHRADGSLIGTVGVQDDVTELIEKEAQLSESNARLAQLSMKMIGAQEDERRRIARDLHDQVGQILTALKLHLAALAKKERVDAPAAALAAPIELVEEVLSHTRNLSASLHPHLLDDLGLEAALHSLIDRFIRPSLPRVDLRCRLAPARGPEAVEMVAFRVVQEALTNVVRHAHATRAGVMLEAGEGWLAIEVIDDGVGFESPDSGFGVQPGASVGLASLRQRVVEAGGTVQLQSEAGRGTSVRARLPWASQSVRESVQESARESGRKEDAA
ncbi:MAG TPA: ATP-binding protein [Ramlibacter sp.]|uniref:PAS domain-containing sensor histidine kinase n=1 Tax=Ramlibacter sp. TaxID=1917967 RepID=UPI002C1798C2|nr:ATP-binding protein [Ramlibacter sp.]HVZ46050.1 ATP-binding protein [Ramlibacter sp.]